MTIHVLAIDDSRTIRNLVRRAMEEAGFTVTTADDGVDGVERFAEVDPDVVITDINMPRMDGFELIEAVRAEPRFRGTPILVLSTEFSDEKKARARSAGATGWITKPFDPDKLGAAIRRVCP